MKDTRLYVCGEPIHVGTLWYTFITESILETAAGHKADVIFISEAHLDQIAAELSSQNDPVIIIGASIPWLNDLYTRLGRTGQRSILLGSNEQTPRRNTCVITLSHREATWDIVHYLRSAGRRKIAFFGFNPRSLNDKAKRDGLLAAATDCQLAIDQERDIFPNYGNIVDCLQRLMARIRQYDAVICTNDLPAVGLMQSARTQGVRIPDDLYVISYGNTILSRLIRPTLSSATLNYGDAGHLAVESFFHLRQNAQISSELISVRGTIAVRETTAGFQTTVSYDSPRRNDPVQFHNSGFFDDPIIKNLSQIEIFFNQIDQTDLRILACLLDGVHYAEIISDLFLSDSALRYRIRKMEKLLKLDSRRELITTIADVATSDSLRELARSAR
jgi:LacI family transcriptional regulator